MEKGSEKGGGIFARSGVEGGMEEKLNKFGEEGWELVGVFTTTTGHGSVSGVHTILKRKK